MSVTRRAIQRKITLLIARLVHIEAHLDQGLYDPKISF